MPFIGSLKYDQSEREGLPGSPAVSSFLSLSYALFIENCGLLPIARMRMSNEVRTDEKGAHHPKETVQVVVIF